MAFLTKYARLFEVRILHGFYLDKGVEKNFFQLDDNDPEDLKFKTAAMKRYDLLPSDLVIEPTPHCRKLLRQHRMVFRQLPTGFIVGIEVNEEELPNGDIAFRPVTQPEPPVRFQFNIKATNRNWANFSAFRLRPNVPAKFYFSNHEETGNISPPSLSLPPGQRFARFHEMGELVYDSGTGQLLESVTGASDSALITSNPPWRSVIDFRFATYRDQQLLPSRFVYTFTPGSGQSISSAEFVLSTPAEPNVATINTSGTGPFLEYPLNFNTLGVAPGRYTLTVNGTPAYQEVKSILIDDELYASDVMAVVSIGQEEGLPDNLKLFEDDGTLRRVGGVTQYPVFELRFKARITYWRYFQHPNQTAALPAPPPGFDVSPPASPNGPLVTYLPIPITKSGSRVKFSNDMMLPNPSNLMVMPDPADPERRHFSDIYLDKITL